ncbi:hypothetical protein BKA64DRAFT_360645 [Cadophora sp. MPI-SDFR-AT-0126]|nr:hypothetical protein BKA64DRAFT_360645 [Leotiomycetes sp. MPI-SDFR-AT-0126]
MSHFLVHFACVTAHSWQLFSSTWKHEVTSSHSHREGSQCTATQFPREMDHRVPPQLPPRSGSENTKVPRPAPPLPPRQGLSFSTGSTTSGRDAPYIVDHYRQPTVADERPSDSDALEDVIKDFRRLQTTPTANVNSPEAPSLFSHSPYDTSTRPYTQQKTTPSGTYPQIPLNSSNPPGFRAPNTSHTDSSKGPHEAPHDARSTFNRPSSSPGTKYNSPLPIENTIPISDLVTSRPYTSRSFLRECPERDSVKFPALWYYPVHAKAFTVCSHCYNTIRGVVESECGISFESFTSTKHQTLHCMFGRPHPRALFKTNNFGALRTFMASRAALRVSACHGMEGVNANSNTTWFRPKHGDIQGMVSCEACFEDYIAHTSFSSRFEKSAPQPAGQIWACDIAVPHIRRTLEAYSDGSRDDWRAFVAAAKHRLTVPACEPYKERTVQSTRWFRSRESLPGCFICEACYLDGIVTTCVEGHFTSAPLSSGELQHKKNLTCTLGYLPMAIALQEAIFSKNFKLWHEAARIFMNEDLCDGKARKGKSYILVPKDDKGTVDFNMCRSCYVCYINVFGFGQYFKQVDMNNHAPAPFGNGYLEWACDFHPSRHGFTKYLDALSEAISVGDFGILGDFIVRYQGVTQPCPRSTFVTGRRWYGNADFSACPDCFEETIQGTALESMIVVRNQIQQAENSCDIYSPRMRALWREACEKNDYAGFVEMVRHRASVYWQTVPVMNRLLSQQRISLMQQQTLNGSSMLYQRLDMTASASSYINYTGISQPTYTYGAADVGYGYASTYGVEAARLGQQANNLVRSSGSAASQVAYLEALWEAIE